MSVAEPIPRHGGRLFVGSDGLSGCPSCGWTGIPTIVDGQRQTDCPACEIGAETTDMWNRRAELFDSKTVKRVRVRVGRNDPCPCGSGRKAKKCHPEYCS